MKEAKKGFTVVEVLIFLAISGAMFTIAFAGSKSQMNSVTFRQGLNSIELKIREIFNNVDNGYFANSGQFTCIAGVSDADDWVKDIIDAANPGGGNSNCVYMGKILNFTADIQTIKIKTLLGSRLDSDIITANSPQLIEDYQLPSDLSISQIQLIDINTSDGDGDTSELNIVPSGFKIGAYRPLEASAGDNLTGATRYYYRGALAWPPEEDAELKTIGKKYLLRLCFVRDDRKGWIQINPKNIEVDYNGEGC